MSPIPVQDLQKEEAWGDGGGVLPAGIHVVTIDKTDDSETSTAGYPQIKLEMSNDFGYITDWVVVIPKTYGKVKSIYEAAGVPVPEGDGVIDATAFQGKRVRIRVADEPGNDGKTRQKVQGYSAPGLATQSNPDPSGSQANATATANADKGLPF